jgi:hypothetical protein
MSRKGGSASLEDQSRQGAVEARFEEPVFAGPRITRGGEILADGGRMTASQTSEATS